MTYAPTTQAEARVGADSIFRLIVKSACLSCEI